MTCYREVILDQSFTWIWTSLWSITFIRTYTLKYGTFPDFSKLCFINILLVLNLACCCSLKYNGESHASEGLKIWDSKSKEIIAFIIVKTRIEVILLTSLELFRLYFKRKFRITVKWRSLCNNFQICLPPTCFESNIPQLNGIFVKTGELTMSYHNYGLQFTLGFTQCYRVCTFSQVHSCHYST